MLLDPDARDPHAVVWFEATGLWTHTADWWHTVAARLNERRELLHRGAMRVLILVMPAAAKAAVRAAASDLWSILREAWPLAAAPPPASPGLSPTALSPLGITRAHPHRQIDPIPLAHLPIDADLETRAASLLAEADHRNTGHPEAALADAHQAVAIYRTLAQERPDAFLPELARSLNTLGTRLAALGLSDDALAAAHEAVALYRALAQDHPEAFLLDLAASLSNLGTTLSALGHHSRALAASTEAMDAWLASVNGLSETDSVVRLLNLVHLAADLRTRTVGVVRRVAADRPDVVPPDLLPDLAKALGAHGQILLAAGRSAEALAHFEEGVEALWPHLERHPETFTGLMQALLDGALSASAGAPSAALQARRAQFQARAERG